jgi:hypothetical protein
MAVSGFFAGSVKRLMEKNLTDEVLLFRTEMAIDRLYSQWLSYYPHGYYFINRRLYSTLVHSCTSVPMDGVVGNL